MYLARTVSQSVSSASGSYSSHLITATRHYSSERPSFFSNVVKNLKDEYSKNKSMHDNLKKFREGTQKLEDSDALRAARKKFQDIEGKLSSENVSTTRIAQATGLLDAVKNMEKLIDKEKLETVSKVREEVSKQSAKAAKKISEAAGTIGSSEVFKAASSTANTLRSEIGSSSLGSHVYSGRAKLRKRTDSYASMSDSATSTTVHIEANESESGIELHKDSKLFAAWQKLREDNKFVNSMADIGNRFKESDNVLARSARMFSDKISQTISSSMRSNELSDALTEIAKVDPNFCKENFLRQCERDIIPNILEAVARADLEVLKDWCFEGTFNVLSAPLKEAVATGAVFESRILDIENVDLVSGDMMEHGPVLIITFTTQEIECIRRMTDNSVIVGDPDTVMRVFNIWVLCRDPSEFRPECAWRLMEAKRDGQEQFL